MIYVIVFSYQVCAQFKILDKLSLYDLKKTVNHDNRLNLITFYLFQRHHSLQSTDTRYVEEKLFFLRKTKKIITQTECQTFLIKNLKIFCFHFDNLLDQREIPKKSENKNVNELLGSCSSTTTQHACSAEKFQYKSDERKPRHTDQQ